VVDRQRIAGGWRARQVKYHINPVHGRANGLPIAHVARDQFNLAADVFEIGPAAATEVVQNAHAIPAGYKGFNQVGADKSCSASDKANRHEAIDLRDDDKPGFAGNRCLGETEEAIKGE
jgi:hypothetical protein